MDYLAGNVQLVIAIFESYFYDYTYKYRKVIIYITYVHNHTIYIRLKSVIFLLVIKK